LSKKSATYKTKSDSLYVLKIDSIIKSKYNNDNKGTDLTQKEVEDSTNNKTITGQYKNGVLVSVFCFHSFDECESTLFHLVDNELVMVVYQIAEPNVRSNKPPNKTYKIYYRDNQAIMQSISTCRGGLFIVPLMMSTKRIS
jgi:hypothetical protein